MFGIESPGLTSSLALADEVMAALDGRMAAAAE
jgi:L-2-hydroxyglutarate oxidase LhgO